MVCDAYNVQLMIGHAHKSDNSIRALADKLFGPDIFSHGNARQMIEEEDETKKNTHSLTHAHNREKSTQKLSKNKRMKTKKHEPIACI